VSLQTSVDLPESEVVAVSVAVKAVPEVFSNNR